MSQNETAPGPVAEISAHNNANVYPQFEFDRHFVNWLKEVKSSLMFSSYKSNYVFSIGLAKNNGRELLSLYRTPQERPMGMYASRKQVLLSTALYLVDYRDQGSVTDNETPENSPYDANFTPRRLCLTNDIDMHDIVCSNEAKVYFCSPLFSCVGQLSESASFKVYWQPPWISKIAAEDRCHLNGLCLRDGVPRYVTAMSRSDVRGGWREQRRTGGVVWDIVTNTLVCQGLSMPHSPRWHNGRLWLLDSGSGYFGYLDDNDQSQFRAVAFIPGFLRGLTFMGSKYAVVGSSLDRQDSLFQGLQLGENLQKHNIQSKCGLFVVDLDTFDVIHNLIFMSDLNEIYDVVSIAQTTRAKLEFINENTARQYRIEN